jgi:DNA invertase Pin-like site-specific DNA recombinase
MPERTVSKTTDAGLLRQMLRKGDPVAHEEVRRLVALGTKRADIASRFGVSSATIKRHADRAGINLPSRAPVMDRNDPKLRDTVSGYLNEGKTETWIAREFAVTSARVRQYLAQVGLTNPSINRAVQERRQEEIYAMAMGGMTYTEIARKMGVTRQAVGYVVGRRRAAVRIELQFTRQEWEAVSKAIGSSSLHDWIVNTAGQNAKT